MPRIGVRRTEPVIQPSEFDKAWAAGYLDGEGTIGIYPLRARKRPSFALKVLLGSVQLESLRWLQERWGGAIRGSSWSRLQARHRPLSVWRISANQALAFLNDVYPYLILKKEHARNARNFQMFSPEHALKDIPYAKGRTLPDEVWQLRARLCAIQQQLNKRGRIAA